MPLCPQITITPVVVTSTGMVQTSIVPVVAATTEEIDQIDTVLAEVEAAVNGKNHIYRQATAPDGNAYALVEGDVWFDTDDGNKQYYWTGTSWTSVQDLGIAAAETAAANAVIAANAATTTANGKNKIVRSTLDPSGTTGYVAGDLWWKMASTSVASDVLGQWTFDGTQWNANALTNAVIATLDAAKITTGYLAAARIEAATIVGDKLVAATITGAKIASETITAANIAVGTITADQIAGATITAAEIAADTITAAEIAAGSITVDRLTVGTLTGFTVRTSGDAGRVELNASTQSLRAIYSSVVRGHVLAASNGTPGIIMHAGATADSAATTYGMVFLKPSYALLAAASTRYVEVDSSQVTVSGPLYSLTNFYNQDATTTANAANTWMSATNGLTRRSTASSQRYKDNIVDLRTVADISPSKLLDVPVRAFSYKTDYLDSADDRAGLMLPGFIAEEVAAVYPIAADKVDGVVESWNDRFVVPGILALVQDLYKRVETLEGTK